jgi:hypothetical protein
MKAEPVGEDSLRVWLSEKELVQWGVSFRKPQICSRQGMRRLTDHVLKSTAYAGVGRLTAELFPVEGGAVLLLSHGRAPGGRRWPAVYYIEDEEALFALAHRWCLLEEKQPIYTALYAFDEGYRLTVCPCRQPTEAHRRLLAEHGRFLGCGEAAGAVCSEHGRLLAAMDALEKLGGKV